MRLLSTRSLELELLHTPPARYAIVSHRWGDESAEVLFTDIGVPARAESKGGYHKIQGACFQATQDMIDYIWLDTCCIDRRNNTELSEAINSMYKWYRGSTVCYAYLYDVSDPSEFIKSYWFLRGWTLQELIAPQVLKFFTRDWRLIGTREELVDPISRHTGINPDILRSARIPREITISQKMVWAKGRETTKVEDRSYSMLGILGISIFPVYGIGDGAFEELQLRLISKSSDQTLFSWYHTFTEPEDVEMVDPDPAPAAVPTPASNSTTDPTANPTPEGEDIVPNPPLNTTGLLASSPSHYLKSYEIPESEFRKNYMDNIKDYGYRSQFSFSNNLIRINLPMKHLIGTVWKALLRCSFDPPGGDQVQRPLVIYLREIQSPWKFARVHLAPEVVEEGQEGVEGVPGSLERLQDTELHLHGYALRKVEVIGWFGGSAESDRPREPPGDPYLLPEPSDAERIETLPRHPPGTKTINILVCGEPGVAAGRVVNFILGYTVLKPLTDYGREPMAVTVVDATLASRHIRIMYVVGPRDPFLELKAYHAALRHMHPFVGLIRDTGGIHLMLMCMVGSRVTPAVNNNFRLFYEYVCRRQVPMFLVVTGLGKSQRMEDWWESHVRDPEFQLIARCVLQHACITVLRGDHGEQAEKYEDSRRLVQKIVYEFMDHLDTTTRAYYPEDVTEWFVSMAKQSMDFILRGQRSALEPEAVKKTLTEGTTLSDSEVSDIVRQLFDDDVQA